MLVKLVSRLREADEERGRLIDLCVHDSFGYSLMNRVNSLSMCRHCDREFNPRVESATIGWGSVIVGNVGPVIEEVRRL